MFKEIEGDRQCRRCNEVKPLSMFSRSIRGLGGRHSHCKPCRSEYQRRVNKLSTKGNKPTSQHWPRDNRERLIDLASKNWARCVEPAANLRAVIGVRI